MDWYYINEATQGDRRTGPLTDDEFFKLIESATITNVTLVWNMGMDSWKTWEVVKESEDGRKLLARMAPSFPEPNNEAPATGSPLILGSEEPDTPPITPRVLGTTVYAGFWIRLGAAVVDWLVLQLLFLPFNIAWSIIFPSSQAAVDPATIADLTKIMMNQWPLALFQLLITALYQVWFVAKYSGTPGKMLLGLRIVGTNGNHPGFSQALTRYLGSWLSIFTFGAGYLMVAFDSQKRGLHDMIASTLVIRERE